MKRTKTWRAEVTIQLESNGETGISSVRMGVIPAEMDGNENLINFLVEALSVSIRKEKDNGAEAIAFSRVMEKLTENYINPQYTLNAKS